MHIIDVKGIYKSYVKNHVLNDISLQVYNGEMIAIMGKSGSGKSTLLNVLGFLDYPDQGSYMFRGHPIDYLDEITTTNFRRNNIGFIVQNYALIYEKDVFFNIALPLKFLKMKNKEINEIVSSIAGKLGIVKLLDRFPYELSGGECQRVSIARALVKNPDILLADEPTGALDRNTEKEILSIFRELNQQGITILIVTHDNDVTNICNRIISISDGKIV